MRGILTLLLTWVMLGTGCAGRLLPTHDDAHGNLLSVTAKQSAKQSERSLRRQKRRGADPLVVLVERRGVRAIDPVTAEVRWTRTLHVTGHPVASAYAIFVPIQGHRLVALDRKSGIVRWESPLPGEALTGLDTSETTVAATVIDHRRGRSKLVGLSARDGQLRWVRRADSRIGAPAAVGNVVVASIGQQVVALRAGTGWERARIDLPRSSGDPERFDDGAPLYEHVAVRHRSLIAGQGTAFVDLASAMASRVESGFGVDEYAPTFRRSAGLDVMGDAERLRLWVQFLQNGDAPRSAVLLCRRAVIALRLTPEGEATHALWAYLGDGREFVAMDVGESRVTLVREDGSLLALDRGTGAELDRIAGGDPVRGALLLDVDSTERTHLGSVPPRKVMRQLVDMLRDPDPRLLPAQRLAADLLWRTPEPEPRRVVESLARGELRNGPGAADADLRAHALDLLAEPWGRPDEEAVDEILEGLQLEPSYLSDVRPSVGVLARRAVRTGSPEIVPGLVDHLLHPQTPPADLGELVDALAEVGRVQAVEGVATFVRRYHADPQVVYESDALERAIDMLGSVAGDTGADPESADVAARALLEVWRDPFTEPTLRAYMQPRLEALPASRLQDGVLDDQRQRPPQLSAISNPRL